MRLTFLLAVAFCTGAAVIVPLLNEELSDAVGAAAPPVADSPKGPDRIFAQGYVEGLTREIDLRFEGAGRIEAIRVVAGEKVRASQPLANLDSATLQLRLQEAEANLSLAAAQKQRLINGARPETVAVAEADIEVAQARFQQAERRLERAEPLVESDAISDDAFDQIRADYLRTQAELELARTRAVEVAAEAREDEIQMAEAQMQIAEAGVQLARELLDQATLRAPRDGVILKVHVDPGELISLDTEFIPPAITMMDDRELRIRAFVEELDAVRVEPEMNAEITADGLPDHVFRGRIVRCAPSLTPKRHFSNRPNERVDVKVREVVIAIEPSEDAGGLVLGLPVDVYLTPPAENDSDS